MDAVLSVRTLSTSLPSRFAFCSSRNLMRCVAIRPGTITLQVTPSRPASRASVLDQPTRESLSAFERPKLGIGAMTPEDADVITRPHPRSRIPGRTASVTAITDSTIEWKCWSHIDVSCPEAELGGGPPVLL